MAPTLGLFGLQVPDKGASTWWEWECDVQGTVSERGSVTAPLPSCLCSLSLLQVRPNKEKILISTFTRK